MAENIALEGRVKFLTTLITELRLISPSILVTCLLYILIAFILFVRSRYAATFIGSLSPNLLAGSIDTLFAVVLISYVIARTARRDLYQMRFAAYLQAESALRLLQHTWFAMINAASMTIPAAGEDLLDEKYVDQVAAHLDLDRRWGPMQVTRLSLATATAVTVKEKIGMLTTRYVTALSPDMIVTTSAFENSGLVSQLAMLSGLDATFIAKGTTMQKPFTLAYIKGSLSAVRDFIGMVQKWAEEFEGEKGYRQPVSFIVSREMAESESSKTETGSAYVA